MNTNKPTLIPLSSMESAVEDAYRKMDAIADSTGGKWVIIFWRVSNDGVLKHERVSWHFPADQYEKALNLLKQDIENELDRISVKSHNNLFPPLPRANLPTIEKHG